MPTVQPMQPARAAVTNPASPQRMPAPGASPQGGTTSLPQHLDTPAAGAPSAVPASAPRSGVVAPGTNPAQAPAAPVPASTAPGTVPPAPPPPPVAMDPATAPAATPTDSQKMGSGLYDKLMEMLENPSRYGSEQAQATRTQGYAKLDDERRLSEDRARVDAAKRGMYSSSNLTSSLGDIGERYLRGGADLETNIQRDQAEKFQQDRMSAINAIFGYGDRQRQDSQQQNDLWTKLLELGYVGGPGMPGPTNMPMPTGA